MFLSWKLRLVVLGLMALWDSISGLTALWDSISVYIGRSPREREKEKRNDRRVKKNVQTTPTYTHSTASAVGPCPTLTQISRMLRYWKKANWPRYKLNWDQRQNRISQKIQKVLFSSIRLTYINCYFHIQIIIPACKSLFNVMVLESILETTGNLWWHALEETWVCQTTEWGWMATQVLCGYENALTHCCRHV